MEPDERGRFERAIVPHLDAAYNLAYWLTRDDHAAEDVVQEAYLRAARYFSNFRGDDGRAWILGVVRRVSYDWLKNHRGFAAEAFDETVHDQGDDSVNPAAFIDREHDRIRVQEALKDLAPQLREMIVLRELEGMSYREIAATVEIPIGTVMSRISRGRREMQRRLASCQGEG